MIVTQNQIQNKYDVRLNNRYYLRELVENIVMDESLDEIAYRADVKLITAPDLPQIQPGQRIDIIGIPLGQSAATNLLAPGVVWEVSINTSSIQYISLQVFDQTIYLEKSEDEYLLPAGQTATQRLRRYAADWGIPLGAVADTKIPLAKAVYRAQPRYHMIQSDLVETVSKGGDMYRLRMTPNGLELIRLGSNTTVWMLESGKNIHELNQVSSLEMTVTQVKVLGNAGQDERSPVLAVLKGEITKYGTLQRILNDQKITDTKSAKTAGAKLLCGAQNTISVSGPDINSIRAGDKVRLDGAELIVSAVKHDLGNPGRMNLDLADLDSIKRRFYQ